MNTKGELAALYQPLPLPKAERQACDSQSQKTRGNLGPRASILHQTVTRLPVANQVFLGSWTVDICQEGCSQRSAPQRRHTAHLRRRSPGAPRKPSSWVWGGDEDAQPTWDSVQCQAPGHLSCWDLGRAQSALPTKSVPLWSTQAPEPEQLRPGTCTRCRACFGQFSCRA